MEVFRSMTHQRLQKVITLMQRKPNCSGQHLEFAIYLSQERYDIQHTVRVLATYMAKPTKTSMCAIKKLANYLLYSKDMKMHYPKVGLHETTFQRWYGGNERRDAKQYMLELYSDSDWATCQISDAVPVLA